MASRCTRLLSALAAGGVLTGSLVLGGGTALAQPADDGRTVPARCGERVSAAPGDTVRVTPLLGIPFTRPVTTAMAPIVQTLGGVLCRVQVDVVEPVATAAEKAAPPLKQATDAVSEGAAAVTGPAPESSEAPRSAAPTPRPAAPAPAAPPRLSPQALAAGAPAYAPAFAALPSSFLRFAGPAPTAPAGLRAYDPGTLLGSAFPGMRAGAPAYLGYDPASAVTTASQVQALPIDGLSRGVGAPALLAVLALSGVAAFTVRRVALSRARTTPAAGSAGDAGPGRAATSTAGAGPTGATEVRSPAAAPRDDEPAAGTELVAAGAATGATGTTGT